MNNMKKFVSRAFIATTLTLTASALALATFTIAWFSGPNIDTTSDDYLDGQIGLRNYFFDGRGTEDYPYEIVSPIHFYNLTRLQNIGVFSGKTYFQVGHIFDIEGVPSLKCINRYDREGNPIYEEFLDMGPFCENTRVMTIGGEGVPFIGDIDGQGLPIKNLKVFGNPEDVGVFGYVAHQANLEGLVFENLEVTSLGYNNSVTSEDYKLFSEDIDDIFHSASYLATDTSLSLVEKDPISGNYVTTNLKKLNGATGTVISNLNATNRTLPDTKIFNGYFRATFPTDVEGDRFTYSLIASSPILPEVGEYTSLITGSSNNDLTIDLTKLYENADFNSLKEYQVNAKIYLTASVKVDGYIFSRVIQSYTIELYNNASTYDEGKYTASIFCDYVDQGVQNDKVTGYHHGTNVGLVAGHVDGNMKNCFVFNGTIKFNETGYHPIAAESDMALVGEVGKNVRNDLSPDIGLVVNGDIGVMNFSKIYSMIRSDMTYPNTIQAGQRTPQGATSVVNYVSYKKFINSETIDKFIDYLRYYDGQKENYEFITRTNTSVGSGVWHSYSLSSTIPTDFNSVDFLWNKVVQDEPDNDRGLGVFKIVSSHNQAAMDNPNEYGTYMASNLGDARIINGKPKSKVYFSTAEYDWSKNNDFYWATAENDIPKKATDLPSYSDVMSFDYPFSRDFNYVFELDLSQMEYSYGNDYMYNTNSNFLTNYLKSKLMDKYGNPVEPGTPRFGFMFRSSENEQLTQLSSYMPVKKPGGKQPFTVNGETKYYPSNSIVFHIDNVNGANVSVVGNNEDITIYGYDPNVQEGEVTPLYTMKSKNTGEADMHRYFTYDVVTGDTGTSAVPISGDMKDNDILYGHIFRLPKGDYVLGSYNKDVAANVYFLAVQGQTEGTIGAKEVLAIEDKLEDVDFLLESPTFENYPAGLNKAGFTYKGVFNTASGTIFNDVIEVGGKKYMRVTFNNSPLFFLSGLFRSRTVEHIFMINDQLIDMEQYGFAVN